MKSLCSATTLLLLLLLSVFHCNATLINSSNLFVSGVRPLFAESKYGGLVGGLLLLAALGAAQYGFLPLTTAPIKPPRRRFGNTRFNRRVGRSVGLANFTDYQEAVLTMITFLDAASGRFRDQRETHANK